MIRPNTSPTNENLSRQILNQVCRPDYQPVQAETLFAEAGIPAEEHQTALAVIEQLRAEGTLVALKHKGLALAEDVNLIRGRIDFIRSGAAFVNSADGAIEVFIPPRETGTALPGDQVMVRYHFTKHQGRKTREGTVIRVISRQHRTVVGTLAKSKRIWYVSPMLSKITNDIVVPDAAGGKVGDRVLVQLDDWEDPRLLPEGEIIEVIGPEDNPALDTLAVMKQYELPELFPQDVMAAAETAAITEADFSGRVDMREIFTYTIDPNTARDFDDALSLQKDADGNWLLGVHIADVSHFVQPDSRLDEEALTRGTSVYFPDRVVPMLPVQLSNGLCSLAPNQDRLAFTCMLTLDATGRGINATFHESVIRSRLRLTYHQAYSALTSANGASFPEWQMDSETVNLLKTCNTLAQAIRKRRMEAGSLQLNLPEVEFEIGKDGRITGVNPVINDLSHQLIEEFMLLANEAVCRRLANAGVPCIHRVHDEPDPKKLMDLQEVFIRANVPAGDLTDRMELCDLLVRIQNAPQAHAWQTAVLRSMRRAEYSDQNIGHFGLNKEFYAHFTSPIRRYPDLVVHRQLKTLIKNQNPLYDAGQIRDLARHCSNRETVADEAEREVVELKKIRYFAEELESGNLRDYDAIVTEIRNFGMMIDLPQVMAFGMVHVSHIDFDFFDYVEAEQELRGRRSKVRYGVGSKLKVNIVRVNAERRLLDFCPTKTPQNLKQSNASKKNRARPGGEEPGKKKKSRKGRR